MTVDDLIREHADPGRYGDLPEMTLTQYQAWLIDMAAQVESWVIEATPIGPNESKVTINGVAGFVVLG